MLRAGAVVSPGIVDFMAMFNRLPADLACSAKPDPGRASSSALLLLTVVGVVEVYAVVGPGPTLGETCRGCWVQGWGSQ